MSGPTFSPTASRTTVRWLRCDASGADCQPVDGATGRTYRVRAADVRRTLRAEVTGTNAAGSRVTRSSATSLVPPLPAGALTPPAVLGTPAVGATLAGSVGTWQDPTTRWTRQWLRCDAAGAACAALPATGATYVVAAADAGSTLRLRVTAIVPGTTAVVVDSAPSALVPAPPGPPPGPAATTDRAAPVLSGFAARKKRFEAGRGKGFRITATEAGTASLVVARGKKQKATTLAVAAGESRLAYRGRGLRPGRYVATLIITDTAGNASAPVVARFRVLTRSR